MNFSPVTLSPTAARRFALLATGLVRPHSGVDAALSHHGFVQIDPINVCGRMHEHILRNRVERYNEGDLHRYLHGLSDEAPLDATPMSVNERAAFEHFHPARIVLSAFPLEAWRYLRPQIERRASKRGQWMGRLKAEERRLAERVLAQIAERGALSSLEIDDPTRSHNGWNDSRLAKVVMDKLFGHGRLLIARRIRGRRVYDLPERVLPSAARNAPTPTPAEVSRWTVELKLRQHRLTPLKRTELPHVTDLVQPVRVDGCPALYCLRSDLALLDESASGGDDVRLLAPLDPLIIDRAVVKALWGFDYTWEVYTPAAKRKRGYYALPLLVGDRLVGDVDLKADREAGKLRVVSRRCARGHRSAPAVAALADFLGLALSR